ncbi:phosphopyruvate hydratase [Nocardioides sp.]|uniref:phosphopyruvate hydratase n=1 Tax=Nocardioides sp. TaxID=35761 RepID=UPI00260EA7E2|nr:phosphopyruvate hydratase [Nocardioides sp.]MDI6908186.1 phosphopyruvate hydratase [Nocardioides sp.]
MTCEIRSVRAFEALDSRGRPTVGCVVRLASGQHGRAIVPSGASTGQYEAHELRDHDDRYDGYGTRRAVRSVNETLAHAVVGMDAEDQHEVDRAMEAADGTPELSNLGANAVLAVSLAVAVAGGAHGDGQLWRHLAGDAEALLPTPMVNIFSGGAHAGRTIDIQDVLVVPLGAESFAEAIEWADRVRRATAQLMDRRGHGVTLVADEGGLAANLTTNREGLEIVTDGIAAAGLTPGVDAALAVDVAANQLWDGDGYRLAVEDRTLDPSQWLDTLEEWCNAFPIISVEDPFTDDDWTSWGEATARIGRDRQLLGDDLFATNAQRLARGVAAGVANAVLVKVNQAGTVSRARDVLRLAQSHGYATVVSARSGDTEDTWLADLAVGWGAGQIKVGSTMRSERTAKWNRLLEIEALSSRRLRFAGADALLRPQLAPGRTMLS